MFSEFIDLSAPTLPPGFPHSITETAPLPLDGPTTLQLALTGIATLALYALLRRPKREPAARARRPLTVGANIAKQPVSSRDAA
jgi:hypothetical protein